MVETFPSPQAVSANLGYLHADDQYHRVRHVPEDLQQDFVEMLEGFGFSAIAPATEEIREGIHRAKGIVDSGGVEEFLRTQPFVDGEAIKKQISGMSTEVIRFKGPMYVDPSMVVSAPGFDDWRGRSHTTKAYMDRHGEPKNANSLEVIADYATRDTQLPSIDFGLNLQITDEGVQISAENAHRVAAAKLRGEPLAFKEISIYDHRAQA